MKALITGGAGFIGSHLANSLLAKGWEVVVLDNFSTGFRANLKWDTPGLTLIEGQAADRKLVEKAAEKVNLIYHLAATVGADLVTVSRVRTIHNNIAATEVVASTAAGKVIPFLFTSTSEVYGKLAAKKYSELDNLKLGPSTNPRWCYAASKIVDEHVVLEYGGIVVRLFNTIGPRQSQYYGMVVPRFIHQALNDQPITVYGDGSQKRSFTWVCDVVEAMIKLPQKSFGGEIYNIGHTERISIIELAELIKKLTNSNSEIIYLPEREDPMRHRSIPDLTKIEKLIDYKPTLNLEEMLVKIIEYDKMCHI